MCSGKIGVIGKNCCIWAKVVALRQCVLFGLKLFYLVVFCIWLYSVLFVKVVVLGQKLLYSGKYGCILAKEVVFGQRGCNLAKWLYSGKRIYTFFRIQRIELKKNYMGTHVLCKIIQKKSKELFYKNGKKKSVSR